MKHFIAVQQQKNPIGGFIGTNVGIPSDFPDGFDIQRTGIGSVCHHNIGMNAPQGLLTLGTNPAGPFPVRTANGILCQNTGKGLFSAAVIAFDQNGMGKAVVLHGSGNQIHNFGICRKFRKLHGVLLFPQKSTPPGAKPGCCQ